MPRTPFRHRIVLYSSTLLVVLIAAMLLAVNYQGERFVSARMRLDIGDGRTQVRDAEQQRMRNLQSTAVSVAMYPSLRPLFFEPDGAPTVRDYLVSYKQSYQQEPGNPDLLLIALHADGQVFTHSDRRETLSVPPLAPLLTAPPGPAVSATVLEIDGVAYHVAIAPAEAGGQIYGYILAGAPIDRAFVDKLQLLTGGDIAVAVEKSVISNLPDQILPWREPSQWATAVPVETTPRSIAAAGDRYEAVSTQLGGEVGIRPLVVIMQSHAAAIAPYRRIQMILLAIGLFAAVLGVTLSAIFARSVTAPVAKLVEGTRQVASGNFDCRIDVPAGDEIGELAESFNAMTQGLRERADMQKFVSQSTVDMIQSGAQKKVSGGERVTLTIFFSDMRGFTAMTESIPPEETVRMLNSCLSLQAARVKKFHGDIDKYVGDCVVALFTGEDMELNAIRCAVEIHRALDTLNEANPGHTPLRVGIGIVRGEVILGSIGSEDRLDFTVIGSNVNLCSRLCSRAAPRETLISESTFAAVEGLIAAEKMEPLQVKGFTDPIPVYSIGAKIAANPS